MKEKTICVLKVEPGKAKQAKHCGGRPPLGYRVNTQGEYEIEPETAKIVQEIFNLYELGYSYRKMAEILNTKGYQTGSGQPFDKNSFWNILTQQKYIGTYVWNKAREKSSKSTRNSHAQKPLDKQVIIPGAVPAIIDPQQFDRVQQRMKSRANGASDTKVRYPYLLSGLKVLKCANCGAYMVGNRVTSHGHVYRQYICPNHREHVCPTKAIRADDLDRFAIDALVSNTFNGVNLDELAEAVNSSAPNIRRMFKQRSEVQKAITELTKAIAKGCDQALIDELKKCREKESRLKVQIQAARKSSYSFATTPERRSAQKKLRKYLMSSDGPEVRAYLQEGIKEIIVSNNDVSVSIQAS